MVIATVTVLTYLRTRGVCKARVGLELIARLVECFSKLCRESPHFKGNYWVSLTCVCCVCARVCVCGCVCMCVRGCGRELREWGFLDRMNSIRCNLYIVRVQTYHDNEEMECSCSQWYCPQDSIHACVCVVETDDTECRHNYIVGTIQYTESDCNEYALYCVLLRV